MDTVKIGPVVRRRELQHVDPVCHEADPDIRIPVETEGKIGLPAALDVGTTARRLSEKDAAIVQIDFAEPRRSSHAPIRPRLRD